MSAPQIDPVWSLSNWRINSTHLKYDGERKVLTDTTLPPLSLPLKLWERLYPALVLATRMLDASTMFLSDIAFGESEPCPLDPDCKVLVPLSEHNQKTKSNLRSQVLDVLARNHVIQFDRIFEEHHAWAYTGPLPFEDDFKVLTSLDEGLRSWLAHPDFDSQPLHQKQTVWLFIATSFMHELTHTIRVCRHGDWDEEEPWTEMDVRPNLKTSQPELGTLWERWFFGSPIDLITTRSREPIDFGKHGLAMIDDEFGNIRLQVIPPESIAQLFDAANWKRLQMRMSLRTPTGLSMPSKSSWAMPPFEILCQDTTGFLDASIKDLFGDIICC